MSILGQTPPLLGALPHWTGQAYLGGLHYAHHGEQDDGEESSHSQRQSLSAPE